MIVWDVLPAIRAAIAEELISCGSTQQEAAEILDCAPSAISQYLSGKRGYRIVFEEDIRTRIRDLASALHKGEEIDLASEICKICVKMREGEQACGSCGDVE